MKQVLPQEAERAPEPREDVGVEDAAASERFVLEKRHIGFGLCDSESAEGLGQLLRLSRPLFGVLTSHGVQELCLSSMAHGLLEGIQAQGVRRRPMQA